MKTKWSLFIETQCITHYLCTCQLSGATRTVLIRLDHHQHRHHFHKASSLLCKTVLTVRCCCRCSLSVNQLLSMTVQLLHAPLFKWLRTVAGRIARALISVAFTPAAASTSGKRVVSDVDVIQRCRAFSAHPAALCCLASTAYRRSMHHSKQQPTGADTTFWADRHHSFGNQ